MVWYSHLLKNFPQCCDPYCQRLWCSQKEEVDVFLKFSCFFYDPMSTSVILRLYCVSESSRYLVKNSEIEAHFSFKEADLCILNDGSRG